MTAATYTFTLSAAQSSASSMVVAMRAKQGSSIPGNASRWQGGTMPQGTLNWAAGATTATLTVNTAPNATVDGDAEYEWYKVSSTPSDLTLNTSALPKVTITEDDSSGGGGGDTIVYGPQTTTDSTFVQTGAATHRISGKLADVDPYKLWIGSNATGTDGVRWDYTGFNNWRLVLVTGGTDDVIQTGSVNPSGNPDFTFEQSGGRLKMVAGGATIFDRPDAGKTGTYARAQISSPGQPITITRLAS